MMEKEVKCDDLKIRIEELVREYYHQNHEAKKEYQDGERVQYSGCQTANYNRA